MDSPCWDGDGRRWVLVGRLERERAVRPVLVVVGGVEAECVLEVAVVDDQDPVEALAAEGADPTLGIGVRVWGADRRADDPDALAAEDFIEGVTEFAVAVVKQKAETVPGRRGASAGFAPAVRPNAHLECLCWRRTRSGGARARRRTGLRCGSGRRSRPSGSRGRASSLPVGAGTVANSARLVRVPVAVDGGSGSRGPNLLRR